MWKTLLTWLAHSSTGLVQSGYKSPSRPLSGALAEGKGCSVFDLLAKPIRRLVREKGFDRPTPPQEKAIPLILEGRNVLLIAPTGSGKTEAAFLPVLHMLITNPERPRGIKVLYITPLRALNRDLLDRLEWWCTKLDLKLAVRHGDTEQRERVRQARSLPTY